MTSSIANPGPLGLFGFALTTFVISAYNSGLFGVKSKDPTNQIMGLAIFYGGIAQFIAGMWEFIRGNTFGATAFASYGAFWTCNGFLLIPSTGVDQAYANLSDDVQKHAKSIVLLGWTIFTLIMTAACFRIGSRRLFILFCFVLTTLVLLTIAEFAEMEKMEEVGGYIGIITAALAWYNAVVDLFESYPKTKLPRGKSQVADSHHSTINMVDMNDTSISQ